MVSEYFNNDTSNTAEDYDKVLHGLKLRWTREISMFEEFNSDVNWRTNAVQVPRHRNSTCRCCLKIGCNNNIYIGCKNILVVKILGLQNIFHCPNMFIRSFVHSFMFNKTNMAIASVRPKNASKNIGTVGVPYGTV